VFMKFVPSHDAPRKPVRNYAIDAVPNFNPRKDFLTF
jgi:hypothetical protein